MSKDKIVPPAKAGEESYEDIDIKRDLLGMAGKMAVEAHHGKHSDGHGLVLTDWSLRLTNAIGYISELEDLLKDFQKVAGGLWVNMDSENSELDVLIKRVDASLSSSQSEGQ